MMNLQNDFTKNNKLLQEHLKIWDQKILPFLPDGLEEAAAQSGVLQRKRGIHSVYDLLKIFFLYACSQLSFRILPAAACALGIASVSDTALRKKFAKSAPFLHEVLHAMLKKWNLSPIENLPDRVKNVLLVDASIVRQTGIDQEQERIHLCYSLNQNRMKQIKVTDHHTAESLSHFEFRKGDLVMGDTGYGTAQNFIYAQEQKADVILRINPGSFCLYDADGEKKSLVSLLKQADEQGCLIMDISGFCRYQKKTGFVRVIAEKLPEEQAREARKRKQKKASKNQSKIKQDTLFCAGWVVVITTLGAEYSGEEILYLYRCRWQVELLFKRFKQSFCITTAKAGSKQYAETMILLQLIIWIITEQQVYMCECFLKEKREEEKIIYSTYEKCKVVFEQIKAILCLSWGLFIDLTDEANMRYLSQRKRWRNNQNEEFHMVILPGLFA